MRIATSCGHSEGFLRGSCGRAAVAECVYCNKAFCERHGEQGPDFTNVCDRRGCQEKLRDVNEHLEWKRRVYEFNRMSICADEECEERMHHVCSRCKLMFCERHVREHTIINRSVRPARRELVVMCSHCRGRRHLWD